MIPDYTDYEHKPGANKTLISDPDTGQPIEVEMKDGAAVLPEKKPPQPTSGLAGVPAPNEIEPNQPVNQPTQGSGFRPTQPAAPQPYVPPAVNQ